MTNSEVGHSPIWCPQASGAKEVPDGTGGGQLCISGVKHHADVFGDNGRLGAVFHLQREEVLWTLSKGGRA